MWASLQQLSLLSPEMEEDNSEVLHFELLRTIAEAFTKTMLCYPNHVSRPREPKWT